MSLIFTLNPPSDFAPYGGTDKSLQPSNETENGQRVWFASQCGHGPDKRGENGFGVYVFRQVGQGQARYVDYGGFLQGRGDLGVSGDGVLFVNGSYGSNDNRGVAFSVPGYVPFTSGGTAPVIVTAPSGGDQSAALLAASQALATAQNALTRANYVKTLLDPLNGRVGAVEARAVGVTRDEVWSIAGDRIYNDLTVSGPLREAIVVGGIDQQARDRAAYAVERVNEVANAVAAKADTATVQAIINDQWVRWVSYVDRRLFNILHDRGVRLLEFAGLVPKGKLPVNDKSVRDR